MMPPKFAPNMVVVTGVQRKPRNKMLHVLYSSRNIIYEDTEIKEGDER
jgi:hypothetical protein